MAGMKACVNETMKIATVGPYCAAGCKFFIAVEKERATGIEYMPDLPEGFNAGLH